MAFGEVRCAEDILGEVEVSVSGMEGARRGGGGLGFRRSKVSTDGRCRFVSMRWGYSFEYVDLLDERETG